MAKIILAGASGLIGGRVAQSLGDFELHVVVRRQIEGLPLTVVQHVAEPSEWPALVTALKPDIAISCLGSTIRKAGSKAAFSAIDLDLSLAFAEAAKRGAARQMISVSSVGANASASNFYLSTKGKAEQGLRMIGFDRLDIMRPGLLRGNRSEHRAGESFAILISPFADALMHGPLRRYRSIDSAVVAKAIANLVNLADETVPGVFIHENDDMAALTG